MLGAVLALLCWLAVSALLFPAWLQCLAPVSAGFCWLRCCCGAGLREGASTRESPIRWLLLAVLAVAGAVQWLGANSRSSWCFGASLGRGASALVLRRFTWEGRVRVVLRRFAWEGRVRVGGVFDGPEGHAVLPRHPAHLVSLLD